MKRRAITFPLDMVSSGRGGTQSLLTRVEEWSGSGGFVSGCCTPTVLADVVWEKERERSSWSTVPHK